MTIDDFPRLTTNDLTLREPRIDDADDVYDYMRRGDVQTFIPNVPVNYKQEHAKGYLDGVVDELSLEHKIAWAIQHNSNSKVIGMANIHDISQEHRRGSLGYALNPDYQGQGIMTEALTAIIDYAFSDYTFSQGNHFRRLGAQVAEDNKPSRALLTKLGFNEEGCRKTWMNIRGDWHDTYMYGLLREDWYHG